MPQTKPINFDGSVRTVTENADGSSVFGQSFYAAYKHTYGPKRIEPLVYKNKPFFRDARKVDDFEGDSYMHTIVYEDPEGGSTDFSTALTNGATASSQTARFAIWRGREYASLSLNAEEVRASRSDMGSLLRKKDYETRRMIDKMAYRIDVGLHNGGSGTLASFTPTAPQLTANPGVITLDVNAMCTRFAVGMKLQIATNDPKDGTAATLVNSGATATVMGIQRSSVPGIPTTLTLATGVTLNSWTATGLTAGTTYYLLRHGDGVGFGQNVLNGGICGLKAWLPAPPPVGTPMTSRLDAADRFWGFNRNVDPTRLAGCTYQAQAGEKYQVTFQNAGQELFVNGGGNEDNKMFLYVSPADYTGYSLELGPQVRFADVDEAGTGFKRLKVRTQAGDMTLTADPQIEPGLFYMLDKDAYYIKTLDSVPHIDEQDGLTGLRLSTADAQQIRWRAWYQLIFDEPGKCLVGRCV